MRVALDHAELAASSGDVPVGAVVLYKNEIIAARHNEREVLKKYVEYGNRFISSSGGGPKKNQKNKNLKKKSKRKLRKH